VPWWVREGGAGGKIVGALPLRGFGHSPSLSGSQFWCCLWSWELRAVQPPAFLLLPPGLSLLQQPCLQGSADCKKQCGPEYYLDGASRCTACVSCAQGEGLVLCLAPSRSMGPQ
jgi:hypothetical protein